MVKANRDLLKSPGWDRTSILYQEVRLTSELKSSREGTLHNFNDCGMAGCGGEFGVSRQQRRP
jgi:hypothetical protein